MRAHWSDFQNEPETCCCFLKQKKKPCRACKKLRAWLGHGCWWRFARRSAWWVMCLPGYHLSINSPLLMLFLFFRAPPYMLSQGFRAYSMRFSPCPPAEKRWSLPFCVAERVRYEFKTDSCDCLCEFCGIAVYHYSYRFPLFIPRIHMIQPSQGFLLQPGGPSCGAGDPPVLQGTWNPRV